MLMHMCINKRAVFGEEAVCVAFVCDGARFVIRLSVAAIETTAAGWPPLVTAIEQFSGRRERKQAAKRERKRSRGRGVRCDQEKPLFICIYYIIIGCYCARRGGAGSGSR